ncbi:Mov34/MPN/PAD-1 family protein [Paenibacillus sedimenti]|uniref:M67 family metallopeptidase n=1 Tax=Paenibacillus sedimenti TaxID=2770274 RepID=A0A926KQ50_9BACL|nr:M67 family metallopeptidase [Paenibacillus sedimenti]MBD0381106.1 M67 family metallopeptidase [Paenibacillus sedimenti]
MIVHIRAELYNTIVQYALSMVPHEACGLITGSIHYDIQTKSFIPLNNLARNPEHHFSMSPQEMIPFLTDPANPVIGIFHSHPTAPALPSKADLETLWHTIPTHWILSLLKPSTPDLQIYQIKKAPLTSAHKLSFVIGQ